MEPSPTVFLTFSHTSLTGQISFAFTPNGIHVYKRSPCPFLRSKHRLVCAVLILRSKKEPFLLTQIVLRICIKRGRNHHKSVPTTISDVQYLSDIIVSHKEAAPIEGKAALT